MTIRASSIVIAGLCAIGAMDAGLADDASTAAPETVIETRQQGFKKMGAAMKAIVDQLKTDAPDRARMTAAALAIGAGAEHVSGWFPTGTDADSGLDTDALPYIWKDRARFDSLAQQLVAESKALNSTMAGGDLATLKAQVKTVGAVCGNCHRSFRAD